MKRFATVLLLSLGITGGYMYVANAEDMASVPEELSSAIAELDEAANSKDLDGVIEYYDEDFTNTDGLTTDSLAQALKQIWESYPRLKYTTTIDSWSEEGDLLVAETTTDIRESKRAG